MKNKILYVLGISVFSMASCKQIKKENNEPASAQEVPMETAMVPDGWISNRVEKAKKRLSGTEAGKIIWNAMEAHGGLEKWYKNGPVSFRFNYQPLDGGIPRDTRQTIDTWSSRARHHQSKDSTSQYGWDGRNAWIMAKDSTVFPYNTRFWSLTPYFFMAQPFVLAGQGINLELLSPKNHGEKPQDVVKVTFDEGTGDAPDDYYILYFDAGTHELTVIRYIVSYPGYFGKGEHLPEKFMELSGKQIIDGITFPTGYGIFWLLEDETAGEHITNIMLSEIAFNPKLESSFFDVPEDAAVLEGY